MARLIFPSLVAIWVWLVVAGNATPQQSLSDRPSVKPALATPKSYDRSARRESLIPIGNRRKHGLPVQSRPFNMPPDRLLGGSRLRNRGLILPSRSGHYGKAQALFNAIVKHCSFSVPN